MPIFGKGLIKEETQRGLFESLAALEFARGEIIEALRLWDLRGWNEPSVSD